MLERVREEMARKYRGYSMRLLGYHDFKDNDGEIEGLDFDEVDYILSIKVGNHTLKEIIEMIDKGQLVKLAEDQSLPLPSEWDKVHRYEWAIDKSAMDSMLSNDFRRVEPLK